MSKCPVSLSVIIPTYNEEALVDSCVSRCLEVLQQDFEKFEIILVDDGSTDGTLEKFRNWEKQSNNIKVLSNLVNLNVGASLQRGLVAATCDFAVHNAIDLPLSVESMKELMNHAKDKDVLVLERDAYAGYTYWRRACSAVNCSLNSVLFSSPFTDVNFTQVYRREIVESILPNAKSPSFTTPEMIYRAMRMGLKVDSVRWPYQKRPTGNGAFGKPHDIIWSVYDMLRYRLVLPEKNH